MWGAGRDCTTRGERCFDSAQHRGEQTPCVEPRARVPLIIAHRGASGVAPEGTEAAIDAAIRAGAPMVELDVQMTRDGRLVIFHDDRLERTTNGSGLVCQTPYATMVRLDAGTWFHPRFADARVLLVSQVFQQVPTRMAMNLELKPTPRRRPILERLLRLVHRFGVSRRVLLSSSDPHWLSLLRSTRLPRALISAAPLGDAIAQAVRWGCVAWHPAHTAVRPWHIARAHAAGLRVHVWTVDDLARAHRLIRWGVDGLFTNDPARLLPLCR